MKRIEKSGLKYQTMKGFLWMLSGSGIQSLMQFVVLIVLARLLDPESFGIASAALVVVSFTSILSTLGLGPALVQKKIINELHIGTSLTMSLFLALLFGTIIFLSSSPIADFFHMEELIIILKVMSVVLMIQGISIVSESLLQRELLFNLVVRIQVISYLFYGFTGTILALLGFGVWALIIAYIMQMFVKCLLSLYFQPYKVRFGFNYNSFKELLYFSGGYSLAKISAEISSQGDNFIVGRFLGSNNLGLYSRAYQLMVTPANLLGRVLGEVLFPVMSKIQDNQKEMAYLYGEGIRITTTLMFPTSLFLVINAENIILLLFGKQWLGLLEPFQILALSLLFRSSYKISDSLAKAKGAVYIRALIKWIFAIMILLFSYIGHFYGLIGISVGVSIAIVINYILMTMLAVKLTGIKIKNLTYVHIGGFIIASIYWLSSIPLYQITTKLTNHFILVLLLFIILFIIIFITCILLFPLVFIGKEGKIIINNIKSKLKDNSEG